MSRRALFGLLPLLVLLSAAAGSPPVAPPAGCADDKPAVALTTAVYYCPYYLIAHVPPTKTYYAERCKGTFTSLTIPETDPAPGNCTSFTNCVKVDLESKGKGKDKDRKKVKYKKGAPPDPAKAFPAPADGYSSQELADHRVLAYLETAPGGKTKVKVMLYQVAVTPPAKTGYPKLTFGLGYEVDTKDEPDVTLHYQTIQGKDLTHNVENVYKVKSGKNFFYQVTLDGDTVVQGVKAAK